MVRNLLKCHIGVYARLLNSIVNLKDHFGAFLGHSLSALINLACCMFSLLYIHMNVFNCVGTKSQQRPLLC